jgi:5-methylcytosine-specific restriction protein A
LRAFRETHKLLHCEICGEVEAERYPLTYSEKIFEVHHKTPLYVAITPVRTTLDDLAVLCANCHRTVHVTKNVDDNYKLLLEHFTK